MAASGTETERSASPWRFELEVNDEGHVLLRRPHLSPVAVDLGPEQDACEAMADFLAQRDFGEATSQPHRESLS